MKTVLQIEFSPTLLPEREASLRQNGYKVISVLGVGDARGLDLDKSTIGVVVIGHGAPWLEREDLIEHFRKTLPKIPIIALLRSTDNPFIGADFNCPADNPPRWLRTVAEAQRGTELPN